MSIEEFNITEYSEIVIRAALEYNQSIQSTTNQKALKFFIIKSNTKIFLKY